MYLRGLHMTSFGDNYRLSHTHSTDESILAHLFLPHNLPSASDDYLTESDHRNEHKILEYMNDFLKSLDTTDELPIVSTLQKSIQQWSIIQNKNNCSSPLLKSAIEKLEPGDFLPLYFHAQNAAILIEIDKNSPNQPLISSWQVLLPTETITSSMERHLSCFPVPIYRLPDRTQLSSLLHCELLVDFMNNTIEYSKVQKASHSFDETREVPISHYVCQWWITHFQGVQIDNQVSKSISFKKKHRDEIRITKSSLPFRRSGLWMTVKVVFHTILTKNLGMNVGTIIYKLLITHFLTYIISTRRASMGSSISTDLLIHCIRKITRRLNKVKVRLTPIDVKDVYPWIEKVTQTIKQKIDQIFPNMDWQKSIEEKEKQKYAKLQLNTNTPETYQHACKKLKAYLERRQSNTSFRQSSSYRYGYDWRTLIQTDDEGDGLPSFSALNSYTNDDSGLTLTRIEIWVQSSLEKWLNHKLISTSKYECFEQLQSFYESYQHSSLKFYYADNKSTDPIGYSRFIITSLTIIRSMHIKLCEDKRFERLKLHAIRIPNLFDLFEFLVLPDRDDMIRARDLYDYFTKFDYKPYPDLFSNIESSDAFGVCFADQSLEMNTTLAHIQEQIERDIENKIDEVNREKEKYTILMDKAASLRCECNDNILDLPLYYRKLNYSRKCDRCTIIKEAENIKVHIYERPIPSKRDSALAVIFELQMPKEFRCFRDILWQFINRPNPTPPHNMHEWLDVSPHQSKLRPYYKGSHNCKVKLVSSVKSITQTHYSAPRHVASTPVEGYVFENGLRVQLSPTKATEFQNECRTLTPQLTDSNYKDLQFSINTTGFVQNKVIAELSKCPLELKPAQFIEFGSFRSGSRLQWFNLLVILELDSLPMDEESVAMLLTHALLQYGPVTTDRNTSIDKWCPESHQQLLDDHFIDELVIRLERLLTECESNWQNELLLVIITVIVMRMFTICNSTRKHQMIDLVLKSRTVGEKWIQLISEIIQNPSPTDSEKMDVLRDKIVTIGLACQLTFSIYIDYNHSVTLSNDDVIWLLKLVTTVHDNMVLSKKTTKTSIFMRNLIRYSERILISINPIVGQLLERNSYKILNEFAAMYWAVIRNKDTMDGKWKKKSKDMYDGCYEAEYESNKVSIDFLKGVFSVNNKTVGFLPDRITSDKLFIRVFGHHIFEVQAAGAEDTYITKHGYHAGGKVHYEFNYSYSNGGLTVYERHIQTGEKFQLIPAEYFESELATIFISNYSHWWNENKSMVEFRPIHFQDSNFLSNIHYTLSLKKGFIRTCDTETRQYLINRASSFFQILFYQYFIRLDEESYIYMLHENSFIHIHLSRLGIAFRYNIETNVIISREYSDMYIDENQWFGTLTGLRSGLLLSPIVTINQTNKHYLCRKLIIPFGQVQISKESNSEHQTVTIERKSISNSFLHQYFVFTLNDRLRILQPTDSPTGWLYLALLHAITSHSLPDLYTGMTGMERAFQLLNSAGCWSDQPFEPVSRNILFQIATISPKVSYYPEHFTCYHKIEWTTDSLPYSMQHFGYYLIVKKLVETSEEWNFMYPSLASDDNIQQLFSSKKYNEKLLAKLYWDYRDSYNPTARLSTQMEAEICSMSSTKSYQPVWDNYSRSTNYSQLRLSDDLYGKGNVNLRDYSKLKCFPLSQWLSSENNLKNIWIGLFKFTENLKTINVDRQNDEIERFEILLDFLHYISGKCSSKPFYLQILKSIVKVPTSTLRSVSYPGFVEYRNIEETTFQSHRINLGNLGYQKRSIALREIQDCFVKNSRYENDDLPQIQQINHRLYEINIVLQSWRENAKLRLFLEDIQSHLCSITLVPWNIITQVHPQQFSFESFEHHYQIRLFSTNHSIDERLLKNAREKYLYPHSNYFIQPTASVPIANERKEFPGQMFTSTDAQVSLHNDIANYFKEQLTESWNKFNLTEEYRKEYPTIKEIKHYLESVNQQSIQFWNELITSITFQNELLFKSGSMLRIVPTTLISVFKELWLKEKESKNITNGTDMSSLSFLTVEQRILLGGTMVNWIVQQQIERALHFANQKKREDFEKEISNIPHTNWAPVEHVPWLILELEMNITIREIQVQVARHMIQPMLNNKDESSIRNVVMQMNMGEGKTSVILPMLAVSLCSSTSSLVRIIVLKALFPMNYQSLRYKLGGLLNRCVLPIACRREMNFNETQVQKIFNRLQQGLGNYDVILTSPEDILSFDLLTIDKCRRKEFKTGRLMLSIQRWMKTYARDVLDESDEILHVKYQLIYSIGRQQQVDGGLERWKTIQLVLSLVKENIEDIDRQYHDDVFYKTSERQSHFPEFRLLNHRSFPELCQRIAKAWLNQKSYRQVDEKIILAFILDPNASIDNLNNQFPHHIVQLFLVMRGLLSSEVLFVALKKRHRVNFGVNPSSKFNRLMAVPFRAKDVAAENTEFGHPDVAIVLTQLSYYYTGLNDSQMLRCFNRLNQDESDPEIIYNEWISFEKENETILSIKQWKTINLKDNQQRTRQLFPTLRYNMLVINYFLNYFVFPKEAKQFPNKLVASAWDLSSSLREKIITGFSGTNDTQLLLPVHIRQCDLPELQKTDAIVLNNLFQPNNNHYQDLPISTNSDEILDRIVKDKQMIQVILDVGALFVDGTNRQIAVKWLDLSDKNKIDYAVYFESDSIFVCDRQYGHHAFLTSPASERLDRCVFYLDEIHTRGTDFKFPNDFRAAVTLGNGLTKDRLVQACMRMRKLGKHHWLSFWSSYEVHQQIQTMKNTTNDRITLTDILRWVYENTQQATWDGLHLWATQSLSFQRKVTAFKNIHWTNQQELFTDSMMERLAQECLETEVTELKNMYGVPKTFQTILEIYLARHNRSHVCSSAEIHTAVHKRLLNYGGSKKLLSQLLDEEQQRELEREQELEEERQQKRPSVVVPCKPVLHEEIKKLCEMEGPTLNLLKLNSVFSPITDAFQGTTFYHECQPSGWSPNLWITNEFKCVIQTRGESLDSFLRPARWILVYRNEHIIFVSPFEANWLMGQLYRLYHQQLSPKQVTTTLRLLLPRNKRDQSILVNTMSLTIPPSISPDCGAIPFSIPTEWLVELFVFNGTLYFESNEEQMAYCRNIGVCPKPRTESEEVAFENGWISVDGFVEKSDYRHLLQLQQCRFCFNPLAFIRKLVENRNNTHAPLTSHIGSIIINAFKSAL